MNWEAFAHESSSIKSCILGGKWFSGFPWKKIGNSSRGLAAWLLCKLLKMGRVTSTCKSHSTQRLHFKKCLASCYHLETKPETGLFCNNPTWRSGNSWSLFLVVNKFSVDRKRSPHSCKGMKRLSSLTGQRSCYTVINWSWHRIRFRLTADTVDPVDY